MYYGEVTWLGIIVFFIIVIIEHKKEKKEKDWTVPEKMIRDVDEEVEKFHKWWDENMADKYGKYDKNCGDDNSEP